MKCVIVAGGEKPEGKLALASLIQADFIICADSGANHLYELGFVPHLIVGDFDSIREDVLQAYYEKGCKVETYPVEKDYTDTELAIQLALEKKPQEIDLLGGIGNRLDHSLANVFLLTAFSRESCRLRLVGSDYTAWVITAETIVVGDPGDYVSLLALSKKVNGINLKGFKYPLCNASLARGSTCGISNELLQKEGYISLKNGVVLVVHTKNPE